MAILGTIVGLTVGDVVEKAVGYGLPIVAGQFLYISLAQLVPMLLEIKTRRLQTYAYSALLCGKNV